MRVNEEPTESAQDWVAEHARRYAESGGTDGHDWRGVPTLLLTVRGRRSGKLRRTALIYGEDDGRYLVVASYGGAPQHPQWYGNLVADPQVTVQVRDEVFAATARTADPQEKARLWSKVVAIWPDYDEYQKKTARDIPVVILERAS